MSAEPHSFVKEILKSPLFRNWVATVLMLDAAKVELQKFIEPVIRTFFKKIKKNCSSGSLCQNCSFISNVTCQRPRTCPSTTFTDAIFKGHTKNSPTFKYTDIQTCFDDPWALAKCYMSDRCTAKTTAEADFSCLVNIVINNISFRDHLNARVNPGDGNSIFNQAREVRNRTMHASDLEITEKCLNGNKKVIIKLLSSIGSKSAVIEKIEQLELDCLSERDVINAFNQNLEALTKFQKELKITIPKIRANLKTIKKTCTKAIGKTDITLTALTKSETQRIRAATLIKGKLTKSDTRAIGKRKRTATRTN